MNLVFTRSDTLYPATKRPSAIIYTRHVHKNTASFTTRVVNVKTLVLADRLGIYSSDPFSPRGRNFSRNCPGRCTFLACNLSHRLTLTYERGIQLPRRGVVLSRERENARSEKRRVPARRTRTNFAPKCARDRPAALPKCIRKRTSNLDSLQVRRTWLTLFKRRRRH